MNTQPTHTQYNTCPQCGHRDEWQVLLNIPVHDWRSWCSDCGRTLSASGEPTDASGYTDDLSIEVIS